MDLKPGDVVTLKPGGHMLTVVEVNEDSVACMWMGGEGDLFRETLPLAVLERAGVEDEDEEDDEEDDDEEDDEEEDDEEDDDEEDDDEEDEEEDEAGPRATRSHARRDPPGRSPRSEGALGARHRSDRLQGAATTSRTSPLRARRDDARRSRVGPRRL